MNANYSALNGTKFNCILSAALLCTGIFIPSFLYAQSAGNHALKEVKVKGQTVSKPGIVPAQTVTALDFKRNAANNVAEAIRNLSGINIKDYGGIGGLKTVSVRSLGANHTGVFYDGIQLNDAQNGQVDLGKLSLNNLQDIVLYNGQPDILLLPARAYASASVLMVNPSKPAVSLTKPIVVTAGLKAGSSGLFEPMIQLDQLISKKWAYRINAFDTQANGKYKYTVEGDGSTTPFTRNNSDIHALQTEAAVFYTDRDSSNFNLRVNYYKSERGLPGAVVFYNDYSSQRLWNEDLFLQSRYEKKWDNSLRLLLNTKISQSYTRYLDPDYLNAAGELDQRYKQHEYYLSGAIAYRPLDNLEVSYAADGAINTLTTNLYQYSYPSRFTFLQVVSGSYIDGRSEFKASLLHTTINESPVTGIAVPSRSVFSPALMYTVAPFQNPAFHLRAFYKNTFRNPTFNDLYYTRLGSLSLKPEYVHEYNLGSTFATALPGRLSYITLTADAYYNKVKDKIIAVPGKDIFSWSMRNLGKVDIRGLDVSVKTRYRLNSVWDGLLAINYTYQDAADITDVQSPVYLNQIPYTPKHTLAFNAGITHSHLGLYYNHILSSQRYYLGENIPAYRVPGFSVSDVSFNWMFKFQGLPFSSSIEVNNLYNQQYALIRSFPMPGRSYRLSIKVTI